jgi:hypothetical protein
MNAKHLLPKASQKPLQIPETFYIQGQRQAFEVEVEIKTPKKEAIQVSEFSPGSLIAVCKTYCLQLKCWRISVQDAKHKPKPKYDQTTSSG